MSSRATTTVYGGQSVLMNVLAASTRRFAHAIVIIAAAITSAATADLPEISLMGTRLLWDEGGIAFANLRSGTARYSAPPLQLSSTVNFWTGTARRLISAS